MPQDFTQPTIDWALLTPILIVLGAGVVGVLVEAFVPRHVRRAVQVTIALVAPVAALVSVIWMWTGNARKTVIAASTGGQGAFLLNWANGAGAVGSGSTGGSNAYGMVTVHGKQLGAAVRGDTYVVDPFSLAMQAIILVLAIIAILVIADRTKAKQDPFTPSGAAVPGSAYEELARRKGLQTTEVFPLLMFAVGGMMIFPATSNLLVMFVALEVLSLPLYVLTALSRRRRLLSLEAAFKYFVLGAFASALFIFGIALVYGATGSVSLFDIHMRLKFASSADLPISGFSMQAMLIVGVLLILVGLLFKIGAAPFHMWTPDVYQGAPTPITGFMAACTKAAAFGALMRVLYIIMMSVPTPTRQELSVALWIVAITTMIVGTIIAVVQTDMKRMLAYSSIAHAGFILVGVIGFQVTSPKGGFAQGAIGDLPVAMDTTTATVNSLTQSVSATLFYLIAYGVATIGAFAVVTLVRERSVVTAATPARELAGVGAGSDSGGVSVGESSSQGSADGDSASDGEAQEEVILGEATHITQWAGLGRRSPLLAGVFTLFLLSMAGIPLTAGFIAKFGAFRAAIEGGATVLAVIGVLASAVAVFFYARIIVLMFFTKPKDDSVTVVRPVGFTTIALTLCAVAVLFLGLFPSTVLDLTGQAARFLP